MLIVGCGKSTCIQLLQRLYDPEHGRVFIGLDEISSDISLKDLRSKLSIVSQEPVLFEKTIAENIAYGDNSREVSMDEIINAAKVANVHNFIIQQPLVWQTILARDLNTYVTSFIFFSSEGLWNECWQ